MVGKNGDRILDGGGRGIGDRVQESAPCGSEDERGTRIVPDFPETRPARPDIALPTSAHRAQTDQSPRSTELIRRQEHDHISCVPEGDWVLKAEDVS